MEERKPYVLGMDGGGTSTVCALADCAGRVIARADAPPSNYRKSDLHAVREAIEWGLDGLARQAGLGDRAALRLRAACAGLAGVDTDEDVVRVGEVLRAVVPAETLLVVNDGEIALAGALDDEPGLLVISGTGSIVWARARDGRRLRVGGWDYVMGDEGSGYHIGTRVLRAVAAAHDRRTPPTSLTAEVFAALGVKDFGGMLSAVYEENLTPQGIASLAPLADEAAEAGDAAALALLEESAGELADLAASGVRLAGLDAEPRFLAVPMGGTLLAGGHFSRRFRAILAERFHNVRWVGARRHPAEGAVRLALTAAAALPAAFN
jgi:N-acetylglucosamine kinase-like BadF-type ATPase